MKRIKRAFALTLSLLMALGIAACGSSGSSSSTNDESFEATDNIEVTENKEIQDIPDGAEKTIL